MKSVLIYISVIAICIMAIPALVVLNVKEAPENIKNTLVVYERAEENQPVVESFENLKLNENSFTQFKVLRIETGEIFEICARDYVIGALCAEMPVSFEEEALKAQAVAIYTYAVRKTLDEIENPSEWLKGANFSDNPDVHIAFYDMEKIKEMFGENFDEYYKKVCDAVDSVAGQVLIYNDEPIVAAFHSMSAGRTESAENIWGAKTDYLVAVESAGDVNCSDFSSEQFVSCEQMRSVISDNVENAQLSDDYSSWISIASKSESGTVLQVQLAETVVSGVLLRDWLDLRSAAFDVAYNAEKGGFVFTTYGFGHGVGMSQNGANEMAKEGKKYHEILFHYYTNTKIAEIEFVF